MSFTAENKGLCSNSRTLYANAAIKATAAIIGL